MRMKRKELLDKMKATGIQLDWTAILPEGKEGPTEREGTGIYATRTGDAATITLRGEIGYDIKAGELDKELDTTAKDAKSIRFDIASIGGDVNESVRISALISDVSKKAEVPTRGVEVVASGAIMLMASAKARTSIKAASYMAHASHLAALMVVNANTVGNAAERLKVVLEAADRMQREIYTEAGIAEEVVNKWLTAEEDTWMTPGEALEAGLLTGIEEPRPVDAKMNAAILTEMRIRMRNRK